MCAFMPTCHDMLLHLGLQSGGRLAPNLEQQLSQQVGSLLEVALTVGKLGTKIPFKLGTSIWGSAIPAKSSPAHHPACGSRVVFVVVLLCPEYMRVSHLIACCS